MEPDHVAANRHVTGILRATRGRMEAAVPRLTRLSGGGDAGA